MHSGLFILASEPGAGATVVARALAAAARHRGLRVAALKPVETGCALLDSNPTAGTMAAGLDAVALGALARLAELAGPPPAAALAEVPHAALRPSDTPRLLAAACCHAPLALANPYRFAPPLEPAVAARLADAHIDLDHIARCLAELRREHDLLLVEGCGGLLSPLSARHLQVDLVARLRLPVLLVGHCAPGAISHCLLVLEALRTRSLPVAGVVLRRLQAELRPDQAAYPLEIERFAGPLVRGVLPCFTPEQLDDVEYLGHRFAVHVDVAATLGLTGTGDH